MKIAIPVTNGLLDPHFGHCKRFVLFDIDRETEQITATAEIDAPPHEPGVLPLWLANKKVNTVITGGMGAKAKQLFEQHSIKVVLGAPSRSPVDIAQSFIEGTLQLGANACDH